MQVGVQGPVRRTVVTALACAAVVLSGACTEQQLPSTALDVVVLKTCQELDGLAEPYAVRSEEPPFDLVRPTSSPEQWREDGEAMVEASEPLERLDGLGGLAGRRDLAGRWVALGEYLIEASEDPGAYDASAVAERLYAASGGCSDTIDELE